MSFLPPDRLPDRFPVNDTTNRRAAPLIHLWQLATDLLPIYGGTRGHSIVRAGGDDRRPMTDHRRPTTAGRSSRSVVGGRSSVVGHWSSVVSTGRRPCDN